MMKPLAKKDIHSAMILLLASLVPYLAYFGLILATIMITVP